MKVKIGILVFLLSLLSFSACDDSNDEDNTDDVAETSYLDDFVALNAEMDTLHYMDTTRIVATAVGTDLKYLWTTNSNAPLLPIDGVDTAIYFYADPCVTTGPKQVYCEIQALNDTIKKMATIVIIE
jgi:hypothetical protein